MSLPSLRMPLIVLVSLLALAACNDSPSTQNLSSHSPAASAGAAQTELVHLDVYKSETCGCCQLWIDHADERGFSSTIHHPANLDAVKNRFGIEPRLQSCHTAVTEDGYVFEGHIPARLIHQFLAEKPEGAVGLVVPGMPLGSPGMEVGDRFTPYPVLLLREDGSTAVYAQVENAASQY